MKSFMVLTQKSVSMCTLHTPVLQLDLPPKMYVKNRRGQRLMASRTILERLVVIVGAAICLTS